MLSFFVEAPPLGCRHDEQPLSSQCCSLDTYFLWCHRSLCRSGGDADLQRRPFASTLGQNVLLVDHRRGGDCGGDVAHPIRFVSFPGRLFSFYLAFSGYRVLSRKTPQQRPSKADWTAASIMLLGGLALVAYGVYLLMTSSFGMVAIVFGVIGLLFGMSDMRDFLHHPADKMAWWYTHMTRMLAAYIATVTAFSVVNFQFLPPVARWLWATVAGTVGIVIWTRYYRRKFSGNRADRDVTDLGSV